MAITKAQQKSMVAALRAKSNDHAGLIALTKTYIVTTYPGDTLAYDICQEFLKAAGMKDSNTAVQSLADNHVLAVPYDVCPTCHGLGQSPA